MPGNVYGEQLGASGDFLVRSLKGGLWAIHQGKGKAGGKELHSGRRRRLAFFGSRIVQRVGNDGKAAPGKVAAHLMTVALGDGRPYRDGRFQGVGGTNGRLMPEASLNAINLH